VVVRRVHGQLWVAWMTLRSRRRWIVHVSVLVHLVSEEAEGDVGDQDACEDKNKRKNLHELALLM